MSDTPASCFCITHPALSPENLNTFQAAQRGIDADFQTIDHTVARDSHRFKAWKAIRVEVVFKRRNGQRFLQVALVPLHNQGKIPNVLFHAPQLFLQFGPACPILLELAGLRIGYENHAIGPFEDGDARLLIQYLAGDRVELKADLKTVNLTQV